ncbi:MAG: phosphoenolpyruvate carboxykinase [Trueperaceae bacterium]|nr:phosphoenolpyruvate carboxykinase [Trueperaceae bacterium]
MKHVGHHVKSDSLASFGIRDAATVHWNLTTPELYTAALIRGEGELVHLGPLAVDTGRYTGRSPKDRFVVRDARSDDTVDWGAVNQPMSEAQFAEVRKGILEATRGRDLFVQDVFVGTHPEFRVPVRVITEYGWHSLFVRNMFVRPTRRALDKHEPVYTIVDVPSFRADPDTMGTRNETVIAMNLSERMVLIGSTEYAGEVKKSAFAMMNFELPERGVMPMHCSANVGPDNEVAVFFGLSGTGKTTLSATHDRTLVGDDEHGWSDEGVFNFEGGCYAKIEHLSAQAEPEIYETTRRFATILENVVVDQETRRVNLDDTTKTENMRAAYPISHISNASRVGYAGHPTDIVFLAADAFGVLPPIAKLTPEQVEYYFLSGYTAKLAGTERGVTEPEATFSACFGAPFMPRRPGEYASLLVEKMRAHGAGGWLINTGWTGGPYGTGHRMSISYTRAMIDAALEHRLDDVDTVTDPVFGLHVPTSCPGVPSEVLNPRGTWGDPAAYDAQASKLAQMFRDNFRRFEHQVSDAVRAAGPGGAGTSA